MALSETETELDRDQDIKKRLGFSPALAGAAVYQGLPRVVSPMLEHVPAGLTDFLESGKKITADPTRPLSQIAEFTRDEVKAIQNFARESGVKVPIVSADRAYFDLGDNYFKNIGNKVLGLLGSEPIPPTPSHIGLSSTSLPTAFHEIGHASPIKGSHTARKIFQELGVRMGSGGIPGGLARFGLAGQVLAPPGEDSTEVRKKLYKYAPALVGATYAPELIEELRASSKAVKGARRAGLGTMKSIAELTPAFGTYAGTAAATVMATILAKKIVKALHDKGSKGEQEKTSAAKDPGAGPRSSGILRSSASSAWRIGGSTPPKPKSIKPNTYELGGAAKTRAPAKPPSNKAYHKDMLASLYSPSRGYRQAVPG